MERSISIIVPAYNEEDTIELSVKSLTESLKRHGFDYEIFIFNDASEDLTGLNADILADGDKNIRVFHNQKNMNLGYNFSQGVKIATKTYVGLVPCHGLIDPKSYDLILTACASCEKDVVICYVANPEIRPKSRQIISKVNVTIINWLFGLNLRYYHLNFYRTKLLKKVPASTKSYAVMVESLIYLIKSGASFIEIPFILRPRLHGKSKALRLKNVINILKTYSSLFWLIRICKKRINLN